MVPARKFKGESKEEECHEPDDREWCRRDDPTWIHTTLSIEGNNKICMVDIGAQISVGERKFGHHPPEPGE